LALWFYFSAHRPESGTAAVIASVT
jgi:hypothetical protein